MLVHDSTEYMQVHYTSTGYNFHVEHIYFFLPCAGAYVCRMLYFLNPVREDKKKEKKDILINLLDYKRIESEATT